jgi:prefoldin subunit 5
MDTKERTDSLKDEIAEVRRQLTSLTGSVGEISGAVKNLEKAIAKLKG